MEKRAWQIVDKLQRQRGRDEIEALRLDWQRLLLAGADRCDVAEAWSRSEARRDEVGRGPHAGGPGERPWNGGQSLEKVVRNAPQQKIVPFRIPFGARDPQPQRRKIKNSWNLGVGHRNNPLKASPRILQTSTLRQ